MLGHQHDVHDVNVAVVVEVVAALVIGRVRVVVGIEVIT